MEVKIWKKTRITVFIVIHVLIYKAFRPRFYRQEEIYTLINGWMLNLR